MSSEVPPFDEATTRELLREAQPPPIPAPPARGALTTVAAALAVFLAALVLYIATLAPTVGYGEAARLQTAAHELELSSAAGARPLSVAVAHLATRLNIGDVAYRVNLASAFAAALAMLVVFLLALMLLDATELGGSPRGRLLFAGAGAASLAVAHPFWARAVIADPTPLNVLLIAAVATLWVARLGGAGAWTIPTGAVLLGLLLANQRAIAIVTPVFLVPAFWMLSDSGRRSTGRAIGILALAYVVGLLPLGVLLARDLIELLRTPSPPEAPGMTAKIAGLLRQALGVGPSHPAPVAPALTLFELRVGAAFLAGTFFAAIGLLALLIRRGARPAGALLLALAVGAAAGSRLTGSTTIVAWVPLAAWVAVGAAVVCRRASAGASAALALILVGIPVAFHLVLPRLAALPTLRPSIAAAVSLPAAGRSTFLHPWRAGDRQARSDATELLAAVPAGAFLVTGPDLGEPLRYIQQVEGRNPGVTVIATPAGIDTLIDRHLGRRPIAVAGLDSAGWNAVRREVKLVPHGPFLLAVPRPEALDVADQRFAEGRWWEAAYHYGGVLGNGGTSDREYPESLARWAVALERSGFPELAAAVTARYLAVAGESWSTYQILGELYFAAGARERAATHLAQALAAAPPEEMAAKAYLEGRIAEARGDPAAARAAYRRCLELDAGHRQAAERLAELAAGP